MKQITSKQIKTRRTIATVLVVLCAVVIFGFSHVPGASYPAHPGFLNYIAHFCEYMVFAALLAIAFTGGRLKPWQVVVLAILIASAYAVSDELHQYFIPGRLCDPMDWLTDTLGATLGAIVTMFILRKIDSNSTANNH